uniref:SREBP regulating gene protein n=1 Tax=Glossina pallidipes TaxID=7398 RepID=A0A1B0AJ45_GLOPL
MWPAALTRLLKRRLVYIVFISLIFTYLLVKLVNQKHHLRLLKIKDFSIQRTKPLIWRTLQEHLLTDEPSNRTNPPDIICRNSLQGKELLVDDRGFVCNREHILQNGCCNVESPETLYYTCETCNNSSHCCSIYEYCVSCCLHPEKRPLLELALQAVNGRQLTVFAQVLDQFELCLVKCRTNSHSVEHENRYRDGKVQYCYGPTEAHESQKEVLGIAA